MEWYAMAWKLHLTFRLSANGYPSNATHVPAAFSCDSNKKLLAKKTQGGVLFFVSSDIVKQKGRQQGLWRNGNGH